MSLKTILPASITTIKEAKQLLTDLYNNGEAYHPEDSAADCLEDITPEQAIQLDKLMDDIYNLPGNDNRLNMIFDPCKELLDLLNF